MMMMMAGNVKLKKIEEQCAVVSNIRHVLRVFYWNRTRTSQTVSRCLTPSCIAQSYLSLIH